MFGGLEKPWQARPASKGEKIFLVMLLLITLVLRVYYVYTVSPTLKLTHDEIGYHQMTIQLLDKHIMGYYSSESGAFVTPGYPVFLAGIYYFARWLNTDPLITTRVIQAIISIGSVFLVYSLARRAGGPRIAGLAGIFAAVYLPSFMANNRILTEVLFSFLQLAYLYSLIIAMEREWFRWHALSGALLGLAVLVRPAVAPFLIIPYLILLVVRRDVKYLSYMLVAISAFCLVMSPWWVRNHLVFDKFIMFATQTGNPMLRGTDPYDVYDKFGPSIINNVPDDKMSEVAVQRIINGFKTDPWLWIKWFTVGKLSFLWMKPWGITAALTKNLHLVVFVLIGWTGTFINLFDRDMRWPALLVVFTTFMQLAFIPIERYIYPLTMIMSVMAAVVIGKIVSLAIDSGYLNR